MKANHQLKLMGTIIDLMVEAPTADKLINEAIERLHTYNHRFSANDASSELSVVNHQAGVKAIKVNPELFELIRIGKEHSLAQSSSLNIAIGPVVEAWRIGFSDAKQPDPKLIKSKLRLTNPQDIILNPKEQSVFLSKQGMSLDLGSLAKGYIANQIMTFWIKEGASAALINLGGNLLVHGSNPNRTNGFWTVGIQNPQKIRGNHIAIVPLKNASVVTSGIYERVLKIGKQRYHHILDPSTGSPIRTRIASLSIISHSSLVGEIWTTRLFGQPIPSVLDTINHLPNIEGIIITTDNQVLVSKNLEGKYYKPSDTDIL